MTPCRLCGGQTVEQFRLKVLRKYDVGYHRCEECGSLQTDEPFWLGEAYAGHGTGFDTGAAHRSISNAHLMHTILVVLKWPQDQPCLDYGAGTGLFARLMRDRGYDFRGSDVYGNLFYIDGFPGYGDERLVTAFEVMEHLPNPAADLSVILAGKPDFLFFTTELHEGQGEAWPYLNPAQGQHVFFYSRQGLRILASRLGYKFGHAFGLQMFARDAAALPLVSPTEFRKTYAEALAEFMRAPYRYAAQDNEMLLRRAQ